MRWEVGKWFGKDWAVIRGARLEVLEQMTCDDLKRELVQMKSTYTAYLYHVDGMSSRLLQRKSVYSGGYVYDRLAAFVSLDRTLRASWRRRAPESFAVMKRNLMRDYMRLND